MPNQNNNRKSTYILYIIGYIGIAFFTLQVVSVVAPGDTIFTIAEKYKAATAGDPLYIAWNEVYSFKTLAAVTGAYILFMLYQFTKTKKYLPGKEYGGAAWADVNALNKRFADRKANNNRIYSQNLRISMDPSKTHINNNALIIGGSGTGKSFYLLTPNIYQASAGSRYPGSFVFTDPKAELLKRNGNLLRARGYRVRVLDLTTEGMATSDCYNPFAYIRRATDISKLVTNLIANTNEKNTASKEPFWEKAEFMLLQALFLFVWMEGEKYGYKKNLNSVLDLLDLAEMPTDAERQNKIKSPLDKLFDRLAEDAKRNGIMRHPAVVKYRKSMVGATDTVRSMVITVNARLSIFENEDVHRLLEKDELDLPSMGIETKTALFCVIPDSDTTYNCIAGMLYTQLFQELYTVAASVGKRGELPIPVTFWLDEFCNVVMPSNFMKLYTTMRSRGISAVLIIQSLSQIKELYEKNWETLVENSDVQVYLGGNSQSTFKYMSESIGKTTLWKRSTSKSYGRTGGSSRSEDILGRELMMQEEVRELGNDKCIVLVRGQRPLVDDKFRTYKSEDYKEAEELGEYVHTAQEKSGIEVISNREYESIRKKGGKVGELRLSGKDLERALHGRKLEADELERLIRESPDREDVPTPTDAEQTIDISALALEDVLHIPGFMLSPEELDEVIEGIENGLTDEQIKSYILCGDAKLMRVKRKTIEAIIRRRNT